MDKCVQCNSIPFLRSYILFSSPCLPERFRTATMNASELKEFCCPFFWVSVSCNKKHWLSYYVFYELIFSTSIFFRHLFTLRKFFCQLITIFLWKLRVSWAVSSPGPKIMVQKASSFPIGLVVWVTRASSNKHFQPTIWAWFASWALHLICFVYLWLHLCL